MAGITSIVRDWGVGPSIVRITSEDTLATVAGANYITNQADNIEAYNVGEFTWVLGDLVAVAASDGSQFFEFDGDDFSTLVQLPGGNGEVTLPVVDGDFTVFDGTLGALRDAGYSASDATKTKVVMAGSAVVSSRIAKFIDTDGTIDDTAGTGVNAGSLQAGLSGTAGTLISFPATVTTGSLIVAAVSNSGNTNVTISNASHGQASVYSIQDCGTATGSLLNKSSAGFVSGNLIAASGTAGLTVDGGAPATGLLQVATVSLSAAQFNGMYAAPVVLIAAPGANNLIVVDMMQLIMTFVSTQFAAGGIVAAQYDNTANGLGVAATNTEAAADFAAAASATFAFRGVSGNTVGALPFSTTVNKGLYLSNQTGAFTTGNGTFVVKVYYRVVAVV